jgi:hypothetical protein
LFSLTACFQYGAYLANPHLVALRGGDVFHHIWIWSRNVSNVLRGEPPLTANIFYPDNASSAYSEIESFHSLIYGILAQLGASDAMVYAIILTVSSAATAASMYFLCYAVSRSSIVSTIIGFTFGFAIYRINHLDHAQLVSIYIFLLPLLFTVLYLRDRKPLFLVASALLHVPVFCGPSYHFAALFLVEAPLVLIFVVSSSRQGVRHIVPAVKLSAAIVVAFVVTLPLWKPYLQLFLDGFERDAHHLNVYAFDLSYFFRPSQYQVTYLWAVRFSASFGNMLGYMFFGYSVIAVAVVGLVSMVRHFQRREGVTFTPAFATAALLLFCSSMGSVFMWSGAYIAPNPIFAAVEWFNVLSATRFLPQFAYVGFAILFVALSPYLARVFGGLTEAGRLGLGGLLVFLVLLENRAIFANPEADVSNASLAPPPVYEFLGTLPARDSVVFVPLPLHPLNGSESRFQRQFSYMRFAREHQLHMVNGISGFFPETFHNAVRDFASFPSAPSMQFLAHHSVDYLVLDTTNDPGVETWVAMELMLCDAFVPIYADADFLVYEINHERNLGRCAD